MLPLRRLFALSLALLLAITSQALAVARGAAPASGYAVYCMNGSMVTVAIDADGQPVGEPHLCPDAVAGFAVLAAPPPLPAGRMVAGIGVTWPQPLAHLATAAPAAPQARGPPVRV